MNQCWVKNMYERPPFSAIVKELEEFISALFDDNTKHTMTEATIIKPLVSMNSSTKGIFNEYETKSLKGRIITKEELKSDSTTRSEEIGECTGKICAQRTKSEITHCDMPKLGEEDDSLARPKVLPRKLKPKPPQPQRRPCPPIPMNILTNTRADLEM